MNFVLTATVRSVIVADLNGVLGHDSALLRLTWAEDNLVNEMNSVMNHTPGAGSIARPVDQQSSTLPLYTDAPF